MAIGVGLVGYGLGGRAFHAPYVAVTPGLELRAVVSRDAAKVHADLPDMRVVPDVATLLAEPGIDLVVISSPDQLHAEHALMALRAGKHVLVDKPFAMRLADAQAVADEGERRGLSVTVFQNRRWDSDFRTLKRMIEDGSLGEVAQLESRYERWRPVPVDTWKEAREFGSWFDLGPHLVDQVVCLLGEPEAVTLDMTTVRAGAPSPDYFHAMLRYPKCRVVLHSSKLVADYGLRFSVHGTGGSWIKRGVDPQEAATIAGAVPGGDDWGLDPDDGLYTPADTAQAPHTVPNERGDYRLFWNALAASLRGEGANPVPASEALVTMRVLEAGRRSAEERREVALAEIS